jgi:hypothetical protein
MSIADDIRALSQNGSSVSEIARKLNIRYQHAYNVLKRSNALPQESFAEKPRINKTAQEKPTLTSDQLLRCGFQLSAKWVLTPNGTLQADQPLPKAVGVYAFVKDGVALYVGVATMGLAKRLRFYGKPGATQLTSLRINRTILESLRSTSSIDIYTAMPNDLAWNGLPIHGSAGLELGLIRKYSLPWNVRSAK